MSDQKQPGALGRLVVRVDRFQQLHTLLGFPLAVFKKFGEDRGGSLAGLIAYYGFFSLFPLLLVLVTVLGMVLRGNPDLQERILGTALGQIPVIGDQLRVGSLRGSGIALAVGIATTLWAGLGVTGAFQQAMNDVWHIPIRQRPSFVERRARGLLVLLLLGAFALSATAVAALGTARGTSPPLRVVGFVLSLGLHVALFALAFRILTDKPLGWREIFPGAAAAGVLWTALQLAGSFLVTRRLTNAEEVYGTFALVIGLLFWLYLGAQMIVLCSEINAVLAGRLWPRSLRPPPLEDADERTLTQAARVEERIPGQRIDVSFPREPQAHPGP